MCPPCLGGLALQLDIQLYIVIYIYIYRYLSVLSPPYTWISTHLLAAAVVSRAIRLGLGGHTRHQKEEQYFRHDTPGMR
jgi:hypothetical protein